jgi:hypothetical protein
MRLTPTEPTIPDGARRALADLAVRARALSLQVGQALDRLDRREADEAARRAAATGRRDDA